MTVCVFGSLNLDLVMRVVKLPSPGETLRSHRVERFAGGKGGNQATAVARQGVAVEMVGRLGQDSEGQILLDRLKTEGIGVGGVMVDPEAFTGMAAIAVAEGGENHIILSEGANGRMGLADVERLKPLLAKAKYLMLQLEIPLKTAIAAAKAAKAAGVKVILDPSPAMAIAHTELFSLVDIITPNQVEANRLCGFPVLTPADGLSAARFLQQRGVPGVVVTLGEAGAACATADVLLSVPPYRVTAVDTTACGDAFNGAMVAALHQGRSLYEACQWGNAAGALTATRPGTQIAMPHDYELEGFLSKHAANPSR
ncbi:MAG: ribokinase [Synechococcales cyanobacterium RM1_1_8]|nr:ribokinase [Synechococcales cyanobacterium RM1_1_8]